MKQRSAWSFVDVVILIALIGGAIWITRDIWADIIDVAAANGENSYVMLAPFVCLWLLWVRRERLPFCPPRYSLLGPTCIAAGWACAMAGFSSGVDIVWHLGGLVMVWGAALTILGPSFVRMFIPVVVGSLFLLPTPGAIRQDIALPLQTATAAIAEYAMVTVGLPVIRLGNTLSVNGQQVAVAEACNGMRMVTAFVLVTYAFVFAVPMRHRIRFVFLALSPVIALAVNVIRTIPTVMLYGYAKIELADTFHDLSGWLMLILALGILWTMTATLRWLEIRTAPYVLTEGVGP